MFRLNFARPNRFIRVGNIESTIKRSKRDYFAKEEVISNFKKAMRAEKDIDIRKIIPYCKPSSKQITVGMKRETMNARRLGKANGRLLPIQPDQPYQPGSKHFRPKLGFTKLNLQLQISQSLNTRTNLFVHATQMIFAFSYSMC